MIIYGLRNCDTCRKVIKAFPDAGFRDVRSDGVPQKTLKDALERFGERLVNTRSTTWRGLNKQERNKPHLTLLEQYPALMKRPLIAVDNVLFLGWSSEIESKVKATL